MAKLDTRNNIINVALDLFGKLGYTQTTTKLIAETAGVNEVTIFRHFESKETLFQEITKYYVTNLDFEHRIHDLDRNNFGASMEIVGGDFLTYCFNNTGIYKIQMKLQDDVKNFDKLKLSRTYINGLITYFTILKDENKIKGDPTLMANNFILSILGFFTFYVMTNSIDTDYLEQMVAEHIKSFVANYEC